MSRKPGSARCMLAAAVGLALAATSAGIAAEPTPPSPASAPPAAAEGKPARVTKSLEALDWGRWMIWAAAERRELALGLSRFETAYYAARPTGAVLEEVNRGFDDLAREFMKGGFAEAARMLDRLTRKLDPEQDSNVCSAAWAVRVRIEPQALPLDAKAVRVRADALYDVGHAPPLEMRLRDPLGKVHVLPSDVEEGSVAVLTLPEGAAAGAWKVEWVEADRPEREQRVLRANPFWLLKESPEATKKRLAAMVGAAAADAALQDARDVFAARLPWLTSTMDGSSTTPLSIDLVDYARDLEQEAATLHAGRNPYAGRTGNWWGAFKSGAATIPLRVVAPAAAIGPQATSVSGAAPKGKLPLLVAFHGTGGDENMFSFAYGRGKLAQLAQEHGFLLVCPSTYPFVAQEKHFPRLLEWVARLYAVDETQVYVLGHSLGGITASRLASAFPDRIAKAVCLAGLYAPPAPAVLPPTAVFSAELDRIIPAVHLKSLTADLVARGLPVRCTEQFQLGHTMMVEASLSDALQFLTLEKPAAGK